MSENPFRVALDDDRARIEQVRAETTYVDYAKPFFYDPDAAKRLPAKALGMTRQELLENGYLPVSEMDDEELRVGRCRGKDGRLIAGGARSKTLPRDLYDAMIQEHFERTKEKLRSQLDSSYATLIDVRDDDTAEPETRAKVAQYLVERIEGKTPERVQLTTTKLPYEELIGGIARMSKVESERMRGIGPGDQQEIQDAEVVDVPQGSGPVEDVPGKPEAGDWNPSSGPGRMPGRPAMHESGASPQPGDSGEKPPQHRWSTGAGSGSATPEPGSEASSGDDPEVRAASRSEPATAGVPDTRDERSPVEVLGLHDAALFGDPRITPPYVAPTYDAPTSTGPQEPLDEARSNSAMLRERAEEAAALAERRKLAKERIQGAKKRRIVARTQGREALQKNTIELTENNGRIQFRIGGTE